ncbi:MAG TPA: hypothetical protein VGQ72_05420 [Pyrinomonadaceae bacterium]|jgi:hypothetical protein|nr:hypothetical protein [Pyrinomonadaceae bacterium]
MPACEPVEIIPIETTRDDRAQRFAPFFIQFRARAKKQRVRFGFEV